MLFTLFLCARMVSAQEAYTIKMQVRMEGLPPEYAALGDQEIVAYLKGEKSKTEISSVMYSYVVYFDGDSLTILNDVMGNKSGFTASKAELESAGDKGDAKPVIEYTQEKKKIAGYECSKAIITHTDEVKGGSRTTVWATEKIKTDPTARRAHRGMQHLGDLRGFPLEMEMEATAQGQNVKVVMTTSEVLTTDIPDSVFTPYTEGYKVMPYKEWQEQVKGAQK